MVPLRLFLNTMLWCYWEINIIALKSRTNYSFILMCKKKNFKSSIQWYNGFKLAVKTYWVKHKIGLGGIAGIFNTIWLCKLFALWIVT